MKKNTAQQRLDQAQAFHRLAKTEEYQEFLKPFLMEAVSNTWIDPSTFPNQEKFMESYQYNRAKAMVYQEIINLLESQEARIQQLQKHITAPDKNYKSI